MNLLSGVHIRPVQPNLLSRPSESHATGPGNDLEYAKQNAPAEPVVEVASK
jgi:hypothetical protein